jgi:lysophospholipase L1-like esterase
MTSAPDRLPLSVSKKLVFAGVTFLLLLAVAEVVVRLTGAAETCRSSYKDSPLWSCDPILSFKLKEGLAPAGKPLNRAGFRTHEFGPKRPGTYRIIALGDSCTFGMIVNKFFEYIEKPYPQRLEEIAAERVGAGRIEVLNAGVPGANSYYGVMLLRSKLRGLSPDLITVRYGWNDHLMSRGGQNGSAYREPEDALILHVQDLLLRTALYPFVWRLALEVQGLRHPYTKPTAADIPKEWKPDVPLERYKRNLRRIAELGWAQGAEVWFLTSPTAFVTDENRGQYDKFPNTMAARALIHFSAIPSFERLIKIHDSYNAATREVAGELGVPVVDMDALYRQHAAAHLFGSTDVPHPTQEGHNLEAEALYARLVAEGIVSPVPR